MWLRIIRLILGYGVLLFLIGLVGLSLATRRHPLRAVYESGEAAVLVPGAYRGEGVTLPIGAWRGKRIDAGSSAGVNLIAIGGSVAELYPFTMREGASVLDGKSAVILDYARPENPWYVRWFVYDEVRRVAPRAGETERYLGVMQVRFLPRFPLAVGWFALSR